MCLTRCLAALPCPWWTDQGAGRGPCWCHAPGHVPRQVTTCRGVRPLRLTHLPGQTVSAQHACTPLQLSTPPGHVMPPVTRSPSPDPFLSHHHWLVILKTGSSHPTLLPSTASSCDSSCASSRDFVGPPRSLDRPMDLRACRACCTRCLWWMLTDSAKAIGGDQTQVDAVLPAATAWVRSWTLAWLHAPHSCLPMLGAQGAGSNVCQATLLQTNASLCASSSAWQPCAAPPLLTQSMTHHPEHRAPTHHTTAHQCLILCLIP
jgi:hypothetical protein